MSVHSTVVLAASSADLVALVRHVNIASYENRLGTSRMGRLAIAPEPESACMTWPVAVGGWNHLDRGALIAALREVRDSGWPLTWTLAVLGSDSTAWAVYTSDVDS